MLVMPLSPHNTPFQRRSTSVGFALAAAVGLVMASSIAGATEPRSQSETVTLAQLDSPEAAGGARRHRAHPRIGREMRDSFRACRGAMADTEGGLSERAPRRGILAKRWAGGLGGPGVIIDEQVRKSGKNRQEIKITRRLPDGSTAVVKRTIKRDPQGVSVTGTRTRDTGKTIRFTESFREQPKDTFITARTITDSEGRSHAIKKTVKKNGNLYEVTVARTGPDGKVRTLTRKVEKKGDATIVRFDVSCANGGQLHTEVERTGDRQTTIRRTVVDDTGAERGHMTMTRDGACSKITFTGRKGRTDSITRNCAPTSD